MVSTRIKFVLTGVACGSFANQNRVFVMNKFFNVSRVHIWKVGVNERGLLLEEMFYSRNLKMHGLEEGGMASFQTFVVAKRPNENVHMFNSCVNHTDKL